jgi:LemA protein
MKNYKWLIPVGIIVVLLIIFYSLFAGTYNNMVAKEETVEAQWAQVENVYQRKYDLIPNLVSVARNYAEFEQETLTEVVQARSQATSININAEDLTPEKMQQFEQAQERLNSSLGRLIATFERYPDLKANQNYLKLQDELSGSENRISVERKKFNDAVRDYNTYIRSFPQNLLRGMYGFEKKALFSAEEAAAGGKVDVDEVLNQ